ncbi:PIR Superfamily Protein [Plasmodium ovale wallikeri]|uniref:PIR Superfamily Protein n=1 Tax=Plasmodium ovale wallikeri TaxID=864142 RepID=A0A1A9A499_PLAOA|nr:PIR Superfamily Protein [Plasmodium ovale wallikeri]SBT51366.1 PIR Superfamily Protein [Plasmodium ovale wallikeri]
MEINHSDLSHYDENSCILLNYWIYDKLNHILGDKNTSDVAFCSLQLPWNYPMNNRSNFAYSNKCKDNFDMLNHDEWKKRKELYDYYVDIETLISTANNYVDEYKYYYEYIEKKTELYKYFDDLFISDQSKSSAEISQKARAQAPDPKLLGIEGDPPGKQMALENSQIGTKIGHSLLGIAPVFFTASALYGVLRKLSGYNTNIIRDMDAEEMNEFSGNTQESGDILFDSSENYISYQPM